MDENVNLAAIEDNPTFRGLRGMLDKKYRVYVVTTGAGAGITDHIWAVPGCSSFFVGASFPYAQEETISFLGFKPDISFACEDTAIDLATAAYLRACSADPDAEPIGLALTASVASTKEHRGDHRVHLAVMTKTRTLVANYRLEKGVGLAQRVVDGRMADSMGLALLLAAADRGPTDKYLDMSERARERFFLRPFFDVAGRRFKEDEIDWKRSVLFPGAFNPPHVGHLGMAKGSLARVIFSVTADPPHKGPLPLAELLRRAKMLEGQERLFSYGDALYLDKARRHPDQGFIIGADACLRMLDCKWGVRTSDLLREFASLKTRFHVTGRMIGDKYTTVEDIWAAVPEEFQVLFTELPGRWDVSSTEIRSNGSAQV